MDIQFETIQVDGVHRYAEDFALAHPEHEHQDVRGIQRVTILAGGLQPTRSHLVHHSAAGTFALRQGPWVFIDAPTGGDNPEPDWHQHQRGYQPHEHPGELYNLTDDLTERYNHYNQQPATVKDMSSLLQQIKAEESTRLL